MGQEILYCFKCQTRLLGSDFEKGHAFRVNSQAACSKCVRDLLAHLPDPDAELERLKKAQVPKASGVTSSTAKIPMISSPRLQPPPPRPAIPEPPTPRSRGPLAVAGLVGAIVLVLVLALFFSGSKETRTPPEPIPPLPTPTPVPVPRPNPTNVIGRDLEELDARLALPMKQDKLQEASALLAAARGKHADPDWIQGVEDRVRKIETAARRIAAPLLEQLTIAARRNDQTALKDLRSRIDGLGVTGLTNDINAALATAASDPWIVLDLRSLVAASGATLTPQGDGSVLVSGTTPKTDTFTMSAQVGLRQVRAFRVEALAHSALPSQGPGRNENGNFVLTEFKVQAGATRLGFSGSSSTHEQDKFPSSAAIDDNPLTGWAIAYRFGQPSAAVFHLKTPADLDMITLSLEHQSIFDRHVLGCFRISVTLTELPAPPAPRFAEVATLNPDPVKVETPANVLAYQTKWAAAARLAAARDFAAAAKSLEDARPGVTDDALRKELEADVADFKLAADAMAELPRLLPKWTKGMRLPLDFIGELGSIERVEATVLDTTARGVSVQIEGAAFDIPAGELGAASIAALLALRGEKKPTDARAAAVLAALDGATAADIPARFAEIRGAIDPKEAEARRAFWSAEEEFASMKTRGPSIAAYEKLLQDPTLFAARNKAFLEDRIASTRELFFFADDLAGAGTFALAPSPKLETIWMSSADSAPGKAAANYIETEVFVPPGSTLRAWIYAGGCCQEVLTFHLQGTGLSGPSAKNPRETVTTQPGGEEWIAAKVPTSNLKKKHTDHTGPKEPDRWMWIELGPLKFAEPGPKKLRLLTEQKGFAVAYLAVGVARQAPPREVEVKEFVKNRPPAAYLPTGSILREVWRNIGGDSVADLTGHPKFKEKPDESGPISAIDSWNLGNSYGVRIRGYVHPPETGEYVFWIASDDGGELWLSTDDSAAKKQKLCSLSHAVGQRNWGADPSQKSAPVSLVAGRRYYIEVLQKQGGGGEHVAAGWTLPGGANERPIPPARLSPPGAAPTHKAVRPFFRGLVPDAPTVKSAWVGGRGGAELEIVPSPRKFLRGLKYSVGSNGALCGLRPVFQGPSGDVDGGNLGQTARDPLIGRPGYVVGGMVARGTDRLNAFKLIFVKLSGNRLVMSDRYESEWVGTRGGGTEIRLGDDGTPVIGLHGRAGSEIDGIALILQGR
jgi:hypothetical protein